MNKFVVGKLFGNSNPKLLAWARDLGHCTPEGAWAKCEDSAALLSVAAMSTDPGRLVDLVQVLSKDFVTAYPDDGRVNDILGAIFGVVRARHVVHDAQNAKWAAERDYEQAAQAHTACVALSAKAPVPESVRTATELHLAATARRCTMAQLAVDEASAAGMFSRKLLREMGHKRERALPELHIVVRSAYAQVNLFAVWTGEENESHRYEATQLGGLVACVHEAHAQRVASAAYALSVTLFVALAVLDPEMTRTHLRGGAIPDGEHGDLLDKVLAHIRNADSPYGRRMIRSLLTWENVANSAALALG